MSEIVKKLKLNEGTDIYSNYKTIPSEGLYIPFGADHKMLLVFYEEGGAGGSVSIKAGTGIQATDDLEFFLRNHDAIGLPCAVVAIESGKYLITEGEHKGCIHVVENMNTGTFYVAAIELP